MGLEKKGVSLLLVIVLAACLLCGSALAFVPPPEPFIPPSGIVTIPDQPVPITDEAVTPPTGDDSGLLVTVLTAISCLSLTGFAAVWKREN